MNFSKYDDQIHSLDTESSLWNAEFDLGSINIRLQQPSTITKNKMKQIISREALYALCPDLLSHFEDGISKETLLDIFSSGTEFPQELVY